MHFTDNSPTALAKVRNFVLQERGFCVSDREWKHRLKGYGYDLRQTESGTVVTTLPHGIEICAL